VQSINNKTSFGNLIIIAVVAILLMSIVPVIIKWIQVNPATIGIVRLSIGFLGIAVFVLFTGSKVSVSRKELMWLSILGLIFALHWYSYFYSIKTANASLAAIGVATFGIHLLILSSIFNREKISMSDIVAVIISIGGIYIASPSLDLELGKLQGFMLAIVSGFLYACLPLINRRLDHIPTSTRALGQFGFALLGFLFLLPQSNFELDDYDWQGLILLGVLSTLVAHTLWIKVSTELPTNLTAVIYYCYVPIAMLLSFLMLGESITWQKITGAMMIISANIMVILMHKKTQKAD